MSNAVKLLGALTALVVALTALWAGLTGNAAPVGIAVVLASPAACAEFISNHPAGG